MISNIRRRLNGNTSKIVGGTISLASIALFWTIYSTTDARIRVLETHTAEHCVHIKTIQKQLENISCWVKKLNGLDVKCN